MVVARAHLVEQRRRAPRRRAAHPRPCATSSVELEPAPAHVDDDVGLVDEPLVLEHVTGRRPSMASELVAHLQPGPLRRGAGRDGSTRGGAGASIGVAEEGIDPGYGRIRPDPE